MATLTDTLRARLRRKVGDVADPPYTESELAFKDAELDDIYDEANGDMNLSVALCYEELMGNAARFADYKKNETEEKRSQIFSQLGKLATYYRGLVSSNSSQVKIVGLKQRPPRNKKKPRGW